MSTKTAHAPTDSEVASRVALDTTGTDDSNSSASDTRIEAGAPVVPAPQPETGSEKPLSLSELRKEADAAGVDISDLSPQKRGRPTHAAKREMEARIAAAKAEAPETCVDSPEETHGTGPGTARLDPALEELLGMEPFSDGNAVDRASPQQLLGLALKSQPPSISDCDDGTCASARAAPKPDRAFWGPVLPKLRTRMAAAGFRFRGDSSAMTTAGMAAALGISQTHLRHLERQGVIPSPTRDSANRRMWMAKDVPVLRQRLEKPRANPRPARLGSAQSRSEDA